MTTTFEDFFRAHYAAIEAGVRAGGAPPDIAAEAAQEAFVRTYPRWWRIRHYRNPAAWVQRVAINVRRDLERADRRRRDAAPVQLVDVGMAAPENDDRIEAAVASLPPQQERAVRAYYHEGLSTAEAAELLGISAGAVRFHLSAARASLRPLLATELDHQEA